MSDPRSISKESEQQNIQLPLDAVVHGTGCLLERDGEELLFELPYLRTVLADRLFRARLLARNGWGQEERKGLRFAFYVRSHWLRMPPLMLARHLCAARGTAMSELSTMLGESANRLFANQAARAPQTGEAI